MKRLNLFGTLNGRFIAYSTIEDAIDSVEDAIDYFKNMKEFYLPGETGEIQVIHVFWGTYDPEEVLAHD